MLSLQGRMSVKQRLVSVVALLGLVGSLIVSLPLAARAQTSKDSTFYVVMAHSDDETASWQLVDDFQDHYTVLVTTTQGEGTWGCLQEEETWDYPQTSETPFPKNSDGTPIVGPYMYEGPDSPVGEPDLGERHPLGNPWEGQGSEACKRARIASWHWFLDDMSAVDPGFPNLGISTSASGDPWLDDDYQGEFCPPGTQGSDEGPDRKRLGCVDVWADEMGARVAFDFGNGSLEQPQPFTESEVVAAIEMLRANRADWGIPVLPEAGIMSAAPSCDFSDDSSTFHDQHETVTNAIYNHDFAIGPQYGAVCDGNTNQSAAFLRTQDPNEYTRGEDFRYAAHPGYQQPPDAAEWAYMNSFDPVTFERTGPAQVNYGWLADGNLNTPIDEHTGSHYSPGAWDFPLRTMWKRYGD